MNEFPSIDLMIGQLNKSNKYHDRVIETRNHDLSPDKVHPTGKGYKTISNQTK